MQKDVATFDRYADVYVGFKFLADYHGIPVTDPRSEPAWQLAEARAQMEAVVRNHLPRTSAELTFHDTTLDDFELWRVQAQSSNPPVEISSGYSLGRGKD